MSRFERDHTQQIDPPVEAHQDATEPSDASSDAEASAAHIAELVRRTAERHAAPGRSSIVPPGATGPKPAVPARPTPEPPAVQPVVQQQPMPDATTVQPVVQQHPTPDATTVQPVVPAQATAIAPAVVRPGAQPDVRRVVPRPAWWPPSRQILITAGVIVVLLVGGALALSNILGSSTTTPPPSTLAATVPAGYSLKVTDAITDCAAHSRSKTKASFEAENCVRATRLLATGRVGGRKVLFVVSRIEMASADAAAGVKQVLDGNGTGNLNDLLREGKTFPGAPAKMPSSGYASVQTGAFVTVSEAGFADGGRSASTDPSLRSAAAEVAAMVSAKT